MLELVPITRKEAFAYVERLHRHHKPPVGSVFQIAAAAEGEIGGVAIVGRPVAQALQDGWTLEVNRCCTDGTRNACSFLYSASWKVARGLGYKKLITYTLPKEGGASLRGAGWKLIGEAGGGSWSRKNRPRVDLHPLQIKFKWERTLNG